MVHSESANIMIVELRRMLPDLSAEQCDKFVAYYELLVDWNSRMNLTAVTEPVEVAQKHFYDSLLALPYIKGGERVIDVGAGAGFPSVPLLILRPTLRLTLADSLQKRIGFLETLLKELGLSAVCVHARAEELGQDVKHREKYDLALSRAVAKLPVLMELTLPLVKTGGRSLCYKGDPKAELAESVRAAKLLSCELSTVELPTEYGARSLVICTKKAPTNRLYPRKAGEPQRKPL